jgi:hypothetical protein
MKPLLNVLLIFCTISLFSQSKADSLLLTKTEWTNTSLDYLRFDVDTITYNLAGKRHDLYFDLGNKTITLEERYTVGGIDKRKEGVKFKIKELNKNKLVIYPLDDKVNLDQEDFKKLDYEPFFKKKEYVFYNREKVFSAVDFKKVTFLASTCFGTCPSFSLEIDRDGTVFYQGRIYTKKFTGNFIGNIEPKEMIKLQKIMNRSQLFTIVSNWEQNTKPVDTPRYNYLIELKSGEILEISTNDQHPILDRLSNYLINIPQVTELIRSNKKHSFEKPKVNAYKIVGIED